MTTPTAAQNAKYKIAAQLGLLEGIKAGLLDGTASAASVAAVAALTTIATADATDPATTMALTNINKAKINAIIAALKA
jgi:hypothetical protein